MAFASLCSGWHWPTPAWAWSTTGFAGPLGGMCYAPHGAICVALLAPVTAIYIRAMLTRALADHPPLRRVIEGACVLLTGSETVGIREDGVEWLRQLCAYFHIPAHFQLRLQHCRTRAGPLQSPGQPAA